MIELHIALSIGAVLGAIGAWAFVLTRRSAQQHEADLRTRAEALERDRERLVNELDQMRDELSRTHTRREQAERAAAITAEKLASREQQFVQQNKLLEEAERKLTDTFKALGADALRANNEQFIILARKVFESVIANAKGDVEKRKQAIDALIKPIHELLNKQANAVTALESKRESAYARLDEQIKTIALAHEKLGTETNRLVAALRRPEQRGRWGELQLRNVVELSGMTEHCDFSEQVEVSTQDARLRPDMVVNLPGGGKIVIDSKVALDAYLDSIDPDAERKALLQRHVRQIETHIRQLASKEYWKQFEHAPQLVVMFMPLESALHAALEQKPNLHAEALAQHVLIATPTLLVALLRAVAYGWQQQALAENAKQIADVGQELYERLNTFANHLARVGKAIESATKSYNAAIGSLERRVLPSARKLRELRATNAGEFDGGTLIEIEPSEMTAPELLPEETQQEGRRE